jgi:hypothetical protein
MLPVTVSGFLALFCGVGVAVTYMQETRAPSIHTKRRYLAGTEKNLDALQVTFPAHRPDWMLFWNKRVDSQRSLDKATSVEGLILNKTRKE